jgi:hypothetical protein
MAFPSIQLCPHPEQRTIPPEAVSLEVGMSCRVEQDGQ